MGLIIGPARADTILPPLIESDLVLEDSGSPYYAAADVSIAAGASVTALAGVEIRFAQSASLLVYGRCDLAGSESAPVWLHPAPEATQWGALVYFNADGASTLSHALIEGASYAGGGNWGPAALSVMRTPVTVDHCIFQGNAVCMKSWESEIHLADSDFGPGNSQELVNLQLGQALVERCRFYDGLNHGDGLDLDGIIGALVRDCYFQGGDDDGIDLGRADGPGTIATIVDNTFVAVSDRAVTVNEASTGILSGNRIIGCGMGVEVKDSSVASIDHCSFYGNEVGVRCWEQTAGLGGGDATLVNSIIAGSIASVQVFDAQSSAQVSYCCTDDQLLPGTGNLLADPRYVDPVSGDLALSPDSPCINAGDPFAAADPDGSRSDMGALPFDQLAQRLVINEINYHSAPDFDPGDWIEIFNPEPADANIGGMRFTGDSGSFTFPEGTLVADGDYLVLCSDLAAFLARFPDVDGALGDLGFELDDEGETLSFTGAGGAPMDLVPYDDLPPWPTEPDGGGPTLELSDPDADNALPESWIASEGHGSPGDINPSSVTDAGLPPAARSLAAYPNPFNPATTLRFSLPRPALIDLSVFDLSGRRVAQLVRGHLDAGAHEVSWHAEGLSSGLYLCRLESREAASSLKLLLLK